MRLAICLEDLSAPPPTRILACVALEGRQPGLGLDEHAAVLWQGTIPRACELWVSADDRLMLYRPTDSGTRVTLRRAGRHLDLPRGGPVVARHGDELELGPRRLRLHIHGATPEAHAPRPWAPPDAPRAGRTRRAARAIALGAAFGLTAIPSLELAGAGDDQIEVRDNPPGAPVRPPEPPPKQQKKPKPKPKAPPKAKKEIAK